MYVETNEMVSTGDAVGTITQKEMVSAGDTDISLLGQYQIFLSAKICLNLNCFGGGYSGQVKTQNTLSAKICLNLDFWGGGKLGTKSQNRVNCDFLTNFSTTPASYCIRDSLSHTTYVETNKW